MNLSKLFKPSRNTNESYEAYRVRRCVANETFHERAAGVVFYYSAKKIPFRKNSYV